ncbi:MAG: NADH dehydrogenase [Candidatus Hydrogenedentota bacterium]
MLMTHQDRVRAEIERWCDIYGNDRSALIPILQEIQSKHHRVSDFAMQVVADMLDIHPVEVYGVVSFYQFLHHERQGEFVIRLCRTLSCAMNQNHAVARQLENDLGIRFGQTTPDGKFTLEWANCIGLCDQGPAMLINDRVYTAVTPDQIHDILQECREAFGLHATEHKEDHLL